jgi:hypothetical protein
VAAFAVTVHVFCPTHAELTVCALVDVVHALAANAPHAPLGVP